MKRNIANVITALRIVFSILLLFCSPLSLEFYVLYIAAGITDVLDGTVARKTKTESDFGAIFEKLSTPLVRFWKFLQSFIKFVQTLG